MTRPGRNYRCQFYDSCLSLVALAGSKKSPCQGCPFEHDTGGQGDLEQDLPGCLALLLTIMADRKTISGFSTEKLLDNVFSRMTELVAHIAGQRMGRQLYGFERTTILDQEDARRGHK